MNEHKSPCAALVVVIFFNGGENMKTRFKCILVCTLLACVNTIAAQLPRGKSVARDLVMQMADRLIITTDYCWMSN
ncbi:hypothetical protein MNBD_GAMMA11-2541 [hydrothermal vent metagenome]|uniref:Uncharacterized protein n=1 Tax=hydrothermal vent metagenome TaxID=652676 RepID=A0A3B0XDI7_9ZZZZ